MKFHLEMQPNHLKIIKQILKETLPLTAKIWVFGSRVTGKAKPYSDLDLAIEGSEPLSLGMMALLAHRFDESDLPYKVDIIDWFAIDEDFQKRIMESRIEIIL